MVNKKVVGKEEIKTPFGNFEKVSSKIKTVFGEIYLPEYTQK